MWHKPCRTFHPWCPCIKTRCLFVIGITQDLRVVSEGQNILLILAPMCILWNNLHVVSLSLCNGAIQWLVGVGWEWPVVFNRFPLQMYAWNRWSPIHIFIDLLPNYTFYKNLTILSAGYLRITDVTSLITFNLWKVEKSMKHRLMPVKQERNSVWNLEWGKFRCGP